MKGWPLWLASVLVSVAACHDHSGDGLAPREDVDAAAAADVAAADGNAVVGQLALAALDQQLVEANCAYFVRCGYYAERAPCESVLVFNLAESFDAHIKAGRVRYDAAAAFECVAGIRTGGAGCYFYDPAPPSPLICQSVFVGTIADEAACTVDAECRSGTCCGSDECCVGHCVTFPPSRTVLEGAACTSETDTEQLVCAEGTVCKLTPGGPHKFTCVPRVGVGQSCDEAPCERNLFCLPGATGAVCVKYPDEGQPCSDALSICASRTNYCDKKTLTCVPRGPVGTPCETDSTCARTAYCDIDGTLTCQPRRGPGEACSRTPMCSPYLDCEGDVCTKLPPRPICD